MRQVLVPVAWFTVCTRTPVLSTGPSSTSAPEYREVMVWVVGRMVARGRSKDLTLSRIGVASPGAVYDEICQDHRLSQESGTTVQDERIFITKSASVDYSR